MILPCLSPPAVHGQAHRRLSLTIVNTATLTNNSAGGQQATFTATTTIRTNLMLNQLAGDTCPKCGKPFARVGTALAYAEKQFGKAV